MKKRNGVFLTILLYGIFIIFSSCMGLYSDPDVSEVVYVANDPVIDKDVTEEESEPVAVQEIDTEIDEEPTTEPIIEEEELKLLPIDEYESYIFFDGHLQGLCGDIAETCGLQNENGDAVQIHEFYVLNEALYFSVMCMEPVEPDGEPGGVCHYYKQRSGIIEEIDASEFSFPESVNVQMNKEIFSIYDFLYNGQIMSKVYRGTVATAYLSIDGYYWTTEGLWFSVPESFSTRLKGIYFYPVDGNMRRVLDVGRIW